MSDIQKKLTDLLDERGFQTTDFSNPYKVEVVDIPREIMEELATEIIELFNESRMDHLDALEAKAVRAIQFTYGSELDDNVRLWIQKGIEGMRYAIACEYEDALDVKVDAALDKIPEEHRKALTKILQDTIEYHD